MNIELIGNSMRAVAKHLYDNKLSGGLNYLSVRADDSHMAITRKGADFSNLTPADIFTVDTLAYSSIPADGAEETALHASIYAKRKDINAILHTVPFNASTVAEVGVTIPGILDDMVQIVGPTIRTARVNDARGVLPALKGRNACLLKNEGMIATGRTLDEAYTACLVLEKAAKSFIEATAIGGGKAIPYIEARLQNFVYKKKYSKADQSDKQAAERGTK